MIFRYEATHAALDQFDNVDRPAFEALRTNGSAAANLRRFIEARKAAADRVRAAFLHDTQDFNTPEFVAVMSVDRIRLAARDTFLGHLLVLLP